MLNQSLEQRFSFSAWKIRRLTRLLILAVSILALNIQVITLASSLFLNKVGSEKLPLFFILIGLVSVPAYALFSPLVDRYSRPQLFRYVLFIGIVVILLMRLAINSGSLVIYYLLFIFASFSWDSQVNILWPSLLNDYLTSLEYKRYTSLIGMAQAVGILLGGALVSVISAYLPTRNILIALPLMYGLVILQLFLLERSERRLESNTKEESVGIWQTLKTFPEQVKNYQIIFFLAASSFLVVILIVIAEYECFSVYSQTFTDDQELTRFLGLLRVVYSVVQLFVLYGFTQPLLQRLGVGTMSLVYPITTLISFISLGLNFSLPAAIATSVNSESLNKSINLPVHNLNYNAVPYQIIGRVRAFSDGFLYALGQISAGVLLWAAHSFLTLVQITWLGIALSLLFFLLRYPMGKKYFESLEGMLRSGSVNLDDISEGLTQLPPQSSSVIKELITSEERYTKIKGLELAIGLGQPSQFLEDVEELFPNAHPDVRDASVKLLSSNPDTETINRCQELLKAQNHSLKALGLEVLIASQHHLDEEQIRSCLKDNSQEIRALASVAATQTEAITNPEIKQTCAKLWQSELDQTTGKAIVRVVAFGGGRELIHPLKEILLRGSGEVIRKGLEALANIARPQDEELAQIAVTQLNHPDPTVRATAFEVLRIARSEEMLNYVVNGLEDHDSQVRQKAAMALAAYGEQGLSLAKESLLSANQNLVEAAIAAIGQIRIRKASDILYDYLSPDFQEISHTRQWQQKIPLHTPSWQPLAIAIADYHQRLIQRVLYVLSCLGHARTVNTVKRLLYSTDKRELANAIETLASLRDRRFVLPLMPILEGLANEEAPGTPISANSFWMRTKGYKLLLEALEAKDRWIRIGALIALAGLSSALSKDPDPLVKAVAKEIFRPLDEQPASLNFFMKRLLLLKKVALFKNLSLDELLLIDRALEQEQFLAGETIFTEGSWGEHFYIIAEGKVRIVKKVEEEERDLTFLIPGQHFGEVALFDDAPRWNGAIAVEDCTLFKLEKSSFISLITQRPHIVLEICRFFSQRLRETDKYFPVKLLAASGELLGNR